MRNSQAVLCPLCVCVCGGGGGVSNLWADWFSSLLFVGLVYCVAAVILAM